MPNILILGIAALAIAGVIARPFNWPEAVWVVAATLLLVLAGLLPLDDAMSAIAKGNDVYLFLIGMLLLSEAARTEGLFDFVAARAVRAAKGSSHRLFALTFAVGIAVTAILSNDATAVVLTPAVFAATSKAKIDPLPFLFICALVANAASFLLPISNPANLIVFDGHMPTLMAWLTRFLVPSVLALAATFVTLRWAERTRLAGPYAHEVEQPPLSVGGKIALAGTALTACVLLIVSGYGLRLGLPTAICGALTAAIIVAFHSKAPGPILKSVSWSLLPLVAGLFVLAAAVDHTGLLNKLAHALADRVAVSPMGTAALAGGLTALITNVINNLPAGLIVSSAVAQTHTPQVVHDALLIGVDLGPNLSVTGSLATILWLTAIRREGENVNFRRFLRVGLITMPPALALALAARLVLA